ncbi:MAG: ribonuclease D [Pseudomonadota bacterium]
MTETVSETMYLDSAEGLQATLPRWLQAKPLVLDTEFIRVDTFYPKIGLIQLGDGQGEALVDPVAIPDLRMLDAVLGPQGPLKVLHACSEDLEVLTPLTSNGLGTIHDTQIALAMLGEGLQVGYQKALQLVLDIEIPKDASRTDWLQRPLTQHQLDYAALDVRHLPALYAELVQRLAARDLVGIYEAECAEVCRLPAPVNADITYQDHANGWRLTPRELAVLQALMAWREREAVARDVPRGHLLKPLSVFELARRQPRNATGFSDIPELNPRVARRDGAELLALISQARALPDTDLPQRLPPPLPREASSVYDALKVALAEVSQQTQVPLDVLWRKRLADKVVLAAVDQDIATGASQITGWRASLLTPVVERVLQNHRDELVNWSRARKM